MCALELQANSYVLARLVSQFAELEATMLIFGKLLSLAWLACRHS